MIDEDDFRVVVKPSLSPVQARQLSEVEPWFSAMILSDFRSPCERLVHVHYHSPHTSLVFDAPVHYFIYTSYK